VALPRGEVFAPLVADPKEPEFLISYLRVRSDLRDMDLGAIGLGEARGVIRWPGPEPGDGLQLMLAGAVFAPAEEDWGLGQRLALLVHLYDGASPYGQFYPVEVRSVGFGAHFHI
jgi:hypothetical protein